MDVWDAVAAASLVWLIAESLPSFRWVRAIGHARRPVDPPSIEPVLQAAVDRAWDATQQFVDPEVALGVVCEWLESVATPRDGIAAWRGAAVPVVPSPPAKRFGWVGETLVVVLTYIVSIGLCLGWEDTFGPVGMASVLVPSVVLVAFRYGRAPGLAAAVASSLIWDGFFFGRLEFDARFGPILVAQFVLVLVVSDVLPRLGRRPSESAPVPLRSGRARAAEW